MSRVRVKVCCISSPDEARIAINAGADALGLVGDMPSGPGTISDELAREIAAQVPPPVATFLLTQREGAADIADHVRFCGTTAVQIVRHVDPGVHDDLARLLPPAVRRVQVIHVEDRDTLRLLDDYGERPHAYLLDSGRPGAAVAELGGTGRVHDWTVSAEWVRRSAQPVFLAGGLNAGNVREALEMVRPYGLDLCSGVRTDDRLDAAKLHAFFAALR